MTNMIPSLKKMQPKTCISLLEYLMDKVKDYKMSPEEADAQARSFVYGNCKLHNPHVTRELIDEVFEWRAKHHKR